MVKLLTAFAFFLSFQVLAADKIFSGSNYELISRVSGSPLGQTVDIKIPYYKKVCGERENFGEHYTCGTDHQVCDYSKDTDPCYYRYQRCTYTEDACWREEVSSSLVRVQVNFDPRATLQPGQHENFKIEAELKNGIVKVEGKTLHDHFDYEDVKQRAKLGDLVTINFVLKK